MGIGVSIRGNPHQRVLHCLLQGLVDGYLHVLRFQALLRVGLNARQHLGAHYHQLPWCGQLGQVAAEVLHLHLIQTPNCNFQGLLHAQA